MTTDKKSDMSGISMLMQLESMARAAETVKALQFLIVNETRRLISFRQAYLFSADKVNKGLHNLEVVSSVAIVDGDAPLTKWLEKVVSALHIESGKSTIQQIDAARCPEKLREKWKEYSLPFVLYCPLNLPNGTHIGVLWLTRETPWQDNEIALVKRLAETYAHAWFAVTGLDKLTSNIYLERLVLASILFIVFSFLIIPVRISTLAPVEVTAKDAIIISAPIDGVIKEVVPPPNSIVTPGMSLLKYEDTELRNKYEIAVKALSVAVAEFRQVSQGAFQDIKSSSQVALLKSQVDLRQAELDYATDLLAQVDVKAPQSGLLIYSDKSDWTGRPVRVGQQIMQIADSKKVELQIYLPVKDSIVLLPGAEIRVFLDNDPLNSIPAVLRYASYQAELTPENILAYKVIADLNGGENPPRIGLQGTAKIHGERISLFFYLFRRPIATFRQYLGI